jgi:murein DD-endopeptidase MepM/ murein hydrolase activator NlpD
VASAVPTPTREPKRVAMLPSAEKHQQRPAAPAPGGSYVVQSGDTLTNIASRTGVSIDTLKAANGLSGSTIRIGQRLVLPAGAAAIKPAPEVAKVTARPTPSAPAAKPEPKRVAMAEVAPQPAPANEPRPKSYTPPSQPKETVQQAQPEKKLASLAPESTGIGKLRWPVHGQIVAKFGSQEDGHRNDGIDILVPEGTPVKAAENGVVIYAGNGLKEYGNTVLIRHDDGLVTVYGFAKDLKVKRGDKVTRGEVVADSGMSGSASRPKLHFEIRKNATPVNPLSYLD